MPKRITATHAEFDNNGNLVALGEKKLAGSWKHSVIEIINNIENKKCIYYLKGKMSNSRSVLSINSNNHLTTDSEENNINNLLLF